LDQAANIRYKEAEDVREVGLEPPVDVGDGELVGEAPGGGRPVGGRAADMVGGGEMASRDESMTASYISDVKPFTRHCHCPADIPQLLSRR
jgi:hypothetical protein